MYELLPLSIGIGLVISLLFSEFFGVAPGGMVVPGYFALFLTKPIDVALTIGAGLIAFFIIKLLSSVLLVYGRRRTVLMILIGYIIGMSITYVLPDAFSLWHGDYKVIGYIIPGLIAIWLDRQGIIETLSTLTIVSVISRMVLILVLSVKELKI